ncbi:PREDICTED: fasciclin-like arabinogalactan protein 13 [Nelumbo nucifera]|uniref:FAS1 domain-containing protein n=2 Tax=Nelumbo nucifera TaxID=4432 RepID=A0A822XSU0_NELNU|nr:PREDICTED: fasciclin-like arabinogalactan protein 13 [Nelumbo nucifera]DAD22773.1 TPA_asm: hypothetical protein HUJ06_024236 [Nelumbo nucifera]
MTHKSPTDPSPPFHLKSPPAPSIEIIIPPMASAAPLSLILLALVPCLFLITPQVDGQAAPAPAAAGPVNLTAILEKGGQYTKFIRLLASTHVIDQIENQLNTSTQGLTVFAPTDNAIDSLSAGTLNGLSQQDQSALVLYHVLPQYQSLTSFQTISNPVRTQAGGQSGSLTLNFTSIANNQVNVSTGMVQTQFSNALRDSPPLAVYQVDKVLLPPELFGAKPPTSPPPPAKAPPSSASNTTKPSSAGGPSSSSTDNNSSGSKERTVGVGLAVGIGLMCLGILS